MHGWQRARGGAPARVASPPQGSPPASPPPQRASDSSWPTHAALPQHPHPTTLSCTTVPTEAVMLQMSACLPNFSLRRRGTRQSCDCVTSAPPGPAAWRRGEFGPFSSLSTSAGPATPGPGAPGRPRGVSEGSTARPPHIRMRRRRRRAESKKTAKIGLETVFRSGGAPGGVRGPGKVPRGLP